MYCRGVVLPLKLRALSSPPGVHHIGAVLKSATNVLWTPAAATRDLQATTQDKKVGAVEPKPAAASKDDEVKASIFGLGLVWGWVGPVIKSVVTDIVADKLKAKFGSKKVDKPCAELISTAIKTVCTCLPSG